MCKKFVLFLIKCFTWIFLLFFPLFFPFAFSLLFLLPFPSLSLHMDALNLWLQQLGPTQSSDLGLFQVHQCSLTGPAPTRFSLAEEKWLLFFHLLHVVNDALSLHAQFQRCSDLIWTNTNCEPGIFYQVSWDVWQVKKKNSPVISE